MLAQPQTEIGRLIGQLEAELAGQQPIQQPMAAECELAVVVPVRGEHVERLLKLLGSITAQDVNLRKIEVILVVNNRPDDGTPMWADAFDLNQELLRTPLFRNRDDHAAGIFTSMDARLLRNKLAVYAIDQSSQTCWVEGSNVGRARQRGLAEAVLRFARLGHNGLVMHTDADCWLDDPSFIFKLLWLFRQYPDIVALGGDYTLELNPGDNEAAGLLECLPAYKRYQCYHEMFKDIRRGKVGRTDVLNTLGRCIVHRAFQGIEVGGFKPLPMYEDFEFCIAFEQHNMRIVWGHQLGIGVATAFRISDRTPSSIRDELRTIGDGEHLMVQDAFSEGQTVTLDDAYMDRLMSAVSAMPNGNARLAYLFLHHPVMRMRITGA